MNFPRIAGASLLAFALSALPATAQAPPAKKAAEKKSSAVPAPAPVQAAGQQKPQTPAKVEMLAHLDRSAVWVADRITYTVDLKCQPDIDILLADLSADKLMLDGLQLLGNDMEREAGPGDTTNYKFTYYLTTYSVDAPVLKIAPMVIRYYVKRGGQRLEDSAPLGELQVPAQSITFRSLIPDNQDKHTVRDVRPVGVRPRQYAMVPSVGIGLLVISILPAALIGLALVRRVSRRARRPARLTLIEEPGAFDAVRRADLSSAEGRREAYAKVNALVRDHLARVCGLNAASLTPPEIAPALSACGAPLPADLVASVLTACELALYAPLDFLPSAEACRQTVEQAGQVLSAGR